MSLKQAEHLARGAVACRHCFDVGWVAPPKVDLAQPRWIGSSYWSAIPRTVVLMLNPGSGAGRRDRADSRLRTLLSEFKAGAASFESVLQHQAADIRNWGRGRFAAFVLDGLGLELDRIALANVAWCATLANQYPRQMLEACYARFTSRLLGFLKPDAVVLSGAGTYAFEERIRQELPAALLVRTLHFAHRRGRLVEATETERVRGLLREHALQR